MGAVVGIAASVVLGGGGGAMGGMMGGGLLGNLISGIFGGGAKGAGGAEGIGKAMEGFSPANVLNATANLVNSIMGNAGKEAANTLHKEDGMPKFVRDAVNKAIDEAMNKNKKDVDPECQCKLDETTKDDSLAEIKKLTDQLVEKVRDIVNKRQNEATQDATAPRGEEGQGSQGTPGASGKPGASGAQGSHGGGKISSKSWFAAIAEALGKVYGDKTAEMVKLSDKVSNVSQKQAELAKKGEGIDKKDEKAVKAHETEKQQLAADMTQAQTELQGAGQEMKLIAETASTLLKSIGEALSGMARKQ